MQHRKSPTSTRKAPSFGTIDQAIYPYEDPVDRPLRPVVENNMAANDHYISEFDADLFEQPRGFVDRVSSMVVSLLKRLFILGLLAGIVAYFYPDSISYVTSGLQQLSDFLPDASAEVKLEKIANRVIKTDRWRPADVEKFSEFWDRLDTKAQKELSNKTWFKQVRFKLERQTASSSGTQDKDRDARVALARKLGLLDTDAAIKDILNQVASELTRADKSQNQNATQDGKHVADLNQALREQFEQKPSKPQAARPKPSTKVKPVKQAQTKPASKPQLKSKPKTVRKTTNNTTGKHAKQITPDDIKRILSGYSRNYVLGDAGAIGNLFLGSNNAQQQDANRRLRKEYDALFSSSQQRWIEFQNIHWLHKDNKATGTGSVKSEFTLRDNSRQTNTADVLIELRRVNSKVKITRLKLSNQHSAIKRPPNNIASAKTKSAPATINPPSKEELKDLVARFVSAYQAGDIQGITSLFAKDIVTNTRSGRAETRRDYLELFLSSEDRKIYIQNLQWAIGKTHAKGTGDMEAVILSKDIGLRTIKGKIQFVAKRFDDNLLITHLYHIQHSQ